MLDAITDERLRARLEAHSMPEPNTGCLLWTGATNPKGYGVTAYKGQATQASRVVMQAINGPLETAQYVCHRCDTPACINPAHLFIGSQKENIRDAIKKGRFGARTHERCKGERVHTAKLTEPEVKRIRQLRASGYSAAVLAVLFNVSVWNVRAIVSRKLWRHVA